MEEKMKFPEAGVEAITPTQEKVANQEGATVEQESFNVDEALALEENKLKELTLGGKAKNLADAFELASKLAGSRQ